MLLGLNSTQDLAATMNKMINFDPAAQKLHLEQAHTFKADPAALQALVGSYTSDLGSINITMQNNDLHLLIDGTTTGKQEFVLVPYSPNNFFLSSKSFGVTEVSFKTDSNGTITVYQQGIQLAQRLGSNVKEVEYKDAKGRFSVTIPVGLVLAQPQSDVATLHSTEPVGTYMLAASAIASSSAEPEAASKKFINANLDPAFDQKPADSRQLTVSQTDLTWTQLVYQLPNNQLLAVLVTQKQNVNYFVVAQAKTTDVQAIIPLVNGLLQSFKVQG
jgi:hypothetical protein